MVFLMDFLSFLGISASIIEVIDATNENLDWREVPGAIRQQEKTFSGKKKSIEKVEIWEVDSVIAFGSILAGVG